MRYVNHATINQTAQEQYSQHTRGFHNIAFSRDKVNMIVAPNYVDSMGCKPPGAFPSLRVLCFHLDANINRRCIRFVSV